MKYEDFKIGDVFRYQDDEETVISKSDKYRIITTIDCYGGPTPWVEKDLHFLKPIKEELPEEGLLVSDLGSLVYKLKDNSGYGFDRGNRSLYCLNKGWSFVSNPTQWRKATEQEERDFIEMLKKECEKRGLFEDTKLSECGVNSADGAVNKGIYSVASTPHSFWNKNGKIFYKGKFATPIKETTTTPQVGKQYTHKKGNTYTVIGFTNNLGDREDEDFPVTVVYMDQEGRHWSRPLSRWHGSFELKE